MRLHSMLADPLVLRLGWTLLHSLWLFATIGLVLAILLRLLKRAPLRYLVACAAFAACAGSAVVTFALLRPPANVVPVIPATGGEVVTVDPSASASAVPIASWRLPRVEQVLPWLVAGWLAGILVLSIQHVAAWNRVRRLRRSGLPITTEPWPAVLSRLCQRLRVRRRVALLSSTLLDAPATVGWLKPAILVPVSALSGMPPAQLEALVAHELAHVRRMDYLVNLVQSIVEIVLFYHPAIWWISRIIREERENCCDDIAAQLCPSRRNYAQALVRMEELRAGPLPLAMSAGGGSLLPRIRRLVDAVPRHRRTGSLPVALVILAAMATVLLLGKSRVTAQDAKPDAAWEPKFIDVPIVLSTQPANELSTLLKRRLPEIKLENTAFGDVIDFLRDVTGANIVVNWRDLESAGIDRDAAVTLRVRDITLDKALRLVLDDVGTGAANLSYVADDNVISIATAQSLERTVKRPGGPPGAYYISGVERSGTYSLSDRNITLRQALISAVAGGQGVAGKFAIVVRSDPASGATRRTLIPVDRLIDGQADDIHVQSGDVIMVVDNPPATLPAEADFRVEGDVPWPGGYSLGGGKMNLLQVLVAAGANPPDIADKTLTIYRGAPEGAAFQIRIERLIEKCDDGTILQRGDRVVISDGK
jgi:beta-lactamase regulating signal transducer with metallopeptidase domain